MPYYTVIKQLTLIHFRPKLSLRIKYLSNATRTPIPIKQLPSCSQLINSSPCCPAVPSQPGCKKKWHIRKQDKEEEEEEPFKTGEVVRRRRPLALINRREQHLMLLFSLSLSPLPSSTGQSPYYTIAALSPEHGSLHTTI